MSAAHMMITLLSLIVVAALLKPLAEKLHLPYPPLLVLVDSLSQKYWSVLASTPDYAGITFMI